MITRTLALAGLYALSAAFGLFVGAVDAANERMEAEQLANIWRTTIALSQERSAFGGRFFRCANTNCIIT